MDENNNILLPDLKTLGHRSITFPNQSSSVSPSAVDCTWRVKATQGYLIRLTFNALNLSADNCGDFVEVYDDPFGTKLGKFCAGSEEISRTIFTSGPYLAVRFKTENAQKSWFSVRYSQEQQSKHKIILSIIVIFSCNDNNEFSRLLSPMESKLLWYRVE